MEFFGPNKLGHVLLQLLLLVSISTCFFPSASGQLQDSEFAGKLHVPPAPAPSPAHHGPVHPPLPPPAHPPNHKHPPVKPPVHPPVKPPVHPPVHPPVKPPVHPPVRPPVHPPVHPPVKPPVHPPVRPPVHPPVHPPVKPPIHPPIKPPVHPPVKPPVHPPVRPPVHPPVHPPVKPPVKPPVHPPVSPPVRSFIVVEGVVYCKSCKYRGKDTLLDAKPIAGAVVKLECKNTKYRTVQTAKTDNKGYFLIKAPKTVTSYAYRKCKVSLVSSPLASCKKPSALNGGTAGAVLQPRKSFVVNKLPFVLYSVGPFAFEPTCPR